MSRLRVNAFGISIDGYGAGPDQALDKLIDEMHLVIAPALLGRGENLLAGIDTVSLGYKCTQHASSDHATHMVLTKEP